MSTIFISDLHLCENDPKIADIFLKFLDEVTHSSNTLYILGDFFEVWIGDDDIDAFKLQIIHALKKATQSGLRIFLLHGNRDFLLGRKFMRETGCILLPDQTMVNINGIDTLLMHGDTLCTHDIKYLKFRKKARNWFFKKLFLLKSLKKRQEIAEDYRKKSQSHISTLPDYIMDVTQSEVEKVMLRHNAARLIHGHTHRQAIHSFLLHNQPVSRIVLGAWHEQGNAYIFTNETSEFVNLSY